jgi:hypothetical protein
MKFIHTAADKTKGAVGLGDKKEDEENKEKGEDGADVIKQDGEKKGKKKK